MRAWGVSLHKTLKNRSKNCQKSDEKTEVTVEQTILFSFGTLNGDTYENTILGYGCTLPEWVYTDEEYIAKLNDVAYSTLSEDAIELVKDYEGFTDMYAESPDGTSNININYQSINAVQAIL